MPFLLVFEDTIPYLIRLIVACSKRTSKQGNKYRQATTMTLPFSLRDGTAFGCLLS
jgi:hypothetical protein